MTPPARPQKPPGTPVGPEDHPEAVILDEDLVLAIRNAFRDQLDGFIQAYRNGNHKVQPELVYYEDALQSFRMAAFGEILP